MRDLMQRKEVLELFAQQQYLKDPLEKSLPELAKLCLEFGKYLQISPNDLSILEAGAYLHDVGNVLIDDAALRYPGKLNYMQWEVIRQHPNFGKRLLEETKSFQEVLPIIALHHERINGTGYPNGLEEEQIPFLVQVFSICDIWHSMRSDRNHRRALSLEKSIDSLKQEAEFGLHNSNLVSKFLLFVNNQLITDNQSIIQPLGIAGTVEVFEST